MKEAPLMAQLRPASPTGFVASHPARAASGGSRCKYAVGPRLYYLLLHMANVDPEMIARKMPYRCPQILYRKSAGRVPMKGKNGRVYVGIDWLRETFPGAHAEASFTDKVIELTWEQLEQGLNNGPLLDHLLASLMGKPKP